MILFSDGIPGKRGSLRQKGAQDRGAWVPGGNGELRMLCSGRGSETWRRELPVEGSC